MAKNIKCILIVLSAAMIWNLNGLAQADDTDFNVVDANEVSRRSVNAGIRYPS